MYTALISWPLINNCQVQPALPAPADLPPRHDAFAASPATGRGRGARALGCGL